MTEVVVAHYQEPLTWLPRCLHPARVYSKGPGGDLPNIGREAHTWLYHCATRYNDLADTTIFLQGDPFAHCASVLQQSKFLQPLNRLVALSDLICQEDATGAPNHIGLPITPTWEQLFQEPVPVEFRFAPGAQYAVPRRLIHTRSYTWYVRALDLFTQAGPDADDRFGKTQLPWVFERLWPAIWDEAVA